MLRKLVIPVLALLAVPAISSAQFESGNFETTLFGSFDASRAGDNQGWQASVGGSIGYFLTKEFEVSFNDEVLYNDVGSGSAGASKRILWGNRGWFAADYHFDLGAFQPFVGVFGGYDSPAQERDTHDRNQNRALDGRPVDSWICGPEAGLKYFVNGTTFIYTNVQYIYVGADPTYSQWRGRLGLGFKF